MHLRICLEFNMSSLRDKRYMQLRANLGLIHRLPLMEASIIIMVCSRPTLFGSAGASLTLLLEE
jgi:hypothetical protein